MTTQHQLIDIQIVAAEGAALPAYSSLAASGADVKAHIPHPLTLKSGERILVPTGLKFAIPVGFEIQVRPRSGLALKNGLSVLNTPGTIDADYRGELGIILINLGQEDFVIQPGMRIAQIVLAPVVQARFVPAAELSETLRGANGFGHTGIH
jgi:dUTP pyrophosphatase